MELNIKEPKNMQELRGVLKNIESIPNKYYVAVESNIFDKDNKWIFMRRGPGCKDGRFKLEGIGGGVEETDINFREALKREISEEVGTEAKISIKKFLYARTEEVYDLHKRENKFWIILSYIGTLEDGELQIREKTKNLGYERYLINEIDTKELTDCAKSAYEKISNNWEEIERCIKDMSVKIIYFVHGTTTDNIEHKSTGWIPGELSEKGIKQSIELKEQINLDEIDLVICSDLKRAIDSAEYTFKDLKKIIHDKRIRECNYGDLNGQDSSLVKYEEHIDSKFPNGESLKDVEERLRDFCNYLLENYNGKTIALVAHKAPQLALDVITKNITWEKAIEQDWRKTKNWKPGWIYKIGE